MNGREGDEWYRLDGIMCKSHVILSDVSTTVVQQQPANVVPESQLTFHLSSEASLGRGNPWIAVHVTHR